MQHKLNIKITALTPLVLTKESSSALLTASEDYIAGSIVRGVLASRYIESRALGREAHLDAEFSRLFAGELVFYPAYLTIGAERSVPIPLSVQQNKLDKSALLDLTYRAGEIGYKSMSGTAAIQADGEDCTLERGSVKKKISLHISRASEKERLVGRSEDGGIFNYESVLPGATFVAEVRGSEAALQSLRTGLAGDEFIAYVGRSRSTQYGRVRIELAPIEEGALTIPAGDTVWLRLESDLLSYDLASRAEQVLDELFIALAAELGSEAETLKDEFSIGKIVAKSTRVDSMVGVWAMHRPTSYGLVAGSVFELKKSSPLTEAERVALARVITAGIGARTVEGYGQLRVWTPTELTLGKRAKKQVAEVPAEPHAATLVRRILLRRVLSTVASRAYADARDNIHGPLAGKTHTFVRLENMLTTLEPGADVPERFYQSFQSELREHSAFEKNLQALRLGGVELNKILDGTNEIKCDEAELMVGIEPELAAEVGFRLADYRGELFYTYWLWLLRNARKRSVEKEVNADE